MPECRNYSVHLTSRDLRLLEDLFWQRLMSSDQIRRLGYFTSESRCNCRLRQLRNVGLIDRYVDAPLQLSQRHIYTPSKRGKQLLVAESLIEKSDVARCFRAPSNTMASHLLMLSEIRSALHEISVSSKWVSEGRCRHIYYVGDELRIFKPDGLVVTAGDPQAYTFVEADLGSNSKAQISAKLRSYECYRAEVFPETYGADHFAVAFATVSNPRARILKKVTERSSLDVRIGTFANLEVLFT